ncbi:Dual specificity phosphatase [Quillaja saponaria]|uniref:phosphatidylglycerophosphatase n=1 Tax=Quillaja saponaria TaxID=32244 RepID=A0AAD7Q2N3_QUISA|nr:Dual specificity phosphatase [Quillaja saponaria]
MKIEELEDLESGRNDVDVYEKQVYVTQIAIDEFLILGAVPFPNDVPRLKQLGVGGVITLNEPYETSRLKQLGVGGVITLNEPYETLVPSSLYHPHGIDHLVIPTRDYLFAPSFADINRAVEFIHRNANSGKTTYVHCKAGRGRSTTIVLCYLLMYKKMTPASALEYARSQRPRVLLAPSQWKAAQEFSKHRPSPPSCSPSGDAVLITQADLEHYHSTGDVGKELAIFPEVAKGRPMLARLSCAFAYLRVSGSCVSVNRRLPVSEARAC